MIKGITFDLDGVYFPNGKPNFIKALGELGVSQEEAERVFFQSDEMNKQYKVGKMTDEEFWSWAAKEWRVDKTPQELIELLIAGYDVDPRVVETVKKVRAKGYKTLICTSNFPARINGLQKKFGFLDDFDVAVFSYEVGANKPSPKLFEELISRSGLQAAEIVFADDYEENVVAAKTAGIAALHFESFDKFTEDLTALGVRL
ncbi:HAD family phosphatase [Candidatus Microgenomates bacterium]|nr:HAD family phosphatase [Candidatus Microgenomates bacterium]